MNKCVIWSKATDEHSGEQSGAVQRHTAEQSGRGVKDVVHRCTLQSVGWSEATDSTRGFDDEEAR